MLARGVPVRLTTRARDLRRDDAGNVSWADRIDTISVKGNRIAVCICDAWDRHWSRGATRRLDAMAPAINSLATVLRSKGALVIHAPSDTMDHYEGASARERASSIEPLLFPPRRAPVVYPPLPIDDSDGGSDTGTGDGAEAVNERTWTRQHPAIRIDDELDAVTDIGLEIYTLLVNRGITHYILTGVHANMCIIGRSFGIKEALGWGVSVMFTRDLTDAMYNPARAPYVNHDDGTRLVTGYIEAFLCPSVLASEIIDQGIS